MSRSLEALLDRAARNPDVAAALLRDRCSAVESTAYLSDQDRVILETIDDARLEQMILAIRSSLERVERRDFLIGAVGTAVALGSGTTGCDRERDRQPGRVVSFGLTADEPPAASIVVEELTIDGALDRDAVRRIVLRHASQVWHVENPHECVASVVREAGVPLSTTLVLQVDVEGRVRSARAEVRPREDGRLARCFHKAPMRWRFPRLTSGVSATIKVRLTAKPP